MLLERDTEVAHVQEALEAAAAGTSSLLLLTGPLGIGRTALLQELSAPAGEDVPVLRANAAPMEQDFAFGVVRQLFDSLLTGAPPESCERRLREHGDVARMVLADDALPLGESGSVTLSETVLNGLRSLLADVGADNPLLILVDDLQWADTPSLRWLAYLVKRLHGLRAVLVCALRDGEPGARQLTLREITDSAQRVLRPAPLSLGAARKMIRDQCGEPGDEEFARACHEISVGNPLFL